MESAISKQVENIAEYWQELIKNELVSPENGGALAQKLSASVSAEKDRNTLLLFSSNDALPVVADLDLLTRTAGSLPDTQTQLDWELSAARLTPDCPTPNKLALFHVILEKPVTTLLTHPALLAIGVRKDWKRALYSIFSDQVLPVDSTESLATLLPLVREADKSVGVRAVYIRYYGLLTWADSAEAVLKTAKELSRAVQAIFPKVSVGKKACSDSQANSLLEIAAQRRDLSKAFGAPHLSQFSQAELPEGAGNTLHTGLHLTQTEIGLAVSARSAQDLALQCAQLEAELQIRALAAEQAAGNWLPFEQTGPILFDETRYDGEVAIITGAATGIGKATVQALLERGASVAAFDIKPQISETFSTPAYKGIQVDLTDETATKAAIARVVRTFGGVDMLVLNAGIFPASCNIDALSMEHWRKVMAINVDVNITMLRELYPFLKLAPRYGRVVINSSRNVPAPGPGAVSYSASKAALTQVGRVAALEWANSGIRVNMVNPHAVFDTELWSDEIIKSRAVKYNMTVEQYKTNNLLHVELFSRDVGELIASMLGPLFAKTTGAQVPVDGGSDRVV
ncbi:MAG: SDR family NAD(P)-dependent oxidoreductase [Anaerolineaceae bacterium]|nr:SDR family NAD(P)-dependent oxidoreductase [Anaerolineaceae bacterium]